MTRKRYSNEDVLKLLREIDVHLHDDSDVMSAYRKAWILAWVLKVYGKIGCLAPYIRPLIFGFSNRVSGAGGRMFNA